MSAQGLISYVYDTFSKVNFSIGISNLDDNSFSGITTFTDTRKKIQPLVSKKEKASRNLTLLVICHSALFIAGNFLNSVTFILIQFNANDYADDVIKTLAIISNLSLFSTQGLDILCYYYFNNEFRKVFRSYFRRKIVIRCWKSPVMTNIHRTIKITVFVSFYVSFYFSFYVSFYFSIHFDVIQITTNLTHILRK